VRTRQRHFNQHRLGNREESLGRIVTRNRETDVEEVHVWVSELSHLDDVAHIEAALLIDIPVKGKRTSLVRVFLGGFLFTLGRRRTRVRLNRVEQYVAQLLGVPIGSDGNVVWAIGTHRKR